jgi:aerobic carbon-monoxide dehydrogenase small subunit
MQVMIIVNGRPCTWETGFTQTLADALRAHGFLSVRCGCEKGSCGMCTVWLDGKAVLSCSVLLCRLEGRSVTTLEGVERQAVELGAHLVAEGGDQCGYCAPGYIMTVLAMERELPAPISEEAAREYLAGTLCRCSGYRSKLRAAMKYLARGEKV